MAARLRIAALVLLLALAAQCWLTMRASSATFDEPTYLAAGYAMLTTGVDINSPHPPLMKSLLALPLFLVGSRAVETIPHWAGPSTKPLSFGASFLFENQADPDTMLLAARAMTTLVALGLGGLLWAWSRRLYGPGAALVTLALYVTCPNVVAHASLATLDLGVSAGIAAALYALWRMCRRPSLRTGVVAGVALGVALLIKATALVVVALLPIFLVAAARRTPRERRALVAATATMGFVVVSLITLAYGPHRFGLAAWVNGLQLGVLERDRFMHGGYQAFLWGQYSETGFAWYFLAAFLLKTPVPTLLLTGATVVWLVFQRPRRIFDERFLVLPIATVLLASTAARDNLGLRYILPVYPLLYVLIGGMASTAAAWTLERVRGHAWRTRLAATGAAGLVLWQAAVPLAIAPHYLAYFNGLLGGPAEGIRYLDDSNIDWGQDLKGLAQFFRARGTRDIRGLFHPFHLAPSVGRYYGVELAELTFEEVREPRPGWYAVSAHLLQRPSLTTNPGYRDLRFDWLDRFTPVERIGWSIYVYHFE